jgi:hypothetical protein
MYKGPSLAVPCFTTFSTATIVTCFCALLVPQVAMTVFGPGVLQLVVHCEPLPVAGFCPPLHVTVTRCALFGGSVSAPNVTFSPTHATTLLEITSTISTIVTCFCALLLPQVAVTVFVPPVLQFVVNCEPLPVEGMPPPLHVTLTYDAQFGGH